jgi:nicotinamidase-related amidase
LKALIIIDMQKALFKKRTSVYQEADLISHINQLICKAADQNAPVVLVRHCNDSFLAEGTPDWQLIDDLVIPEDAIWINKQHGSCFQQTGLKEWFHESNIDSVIISGLVSNGCVQASSFDALRLGFQVTLVSDGHSTFAKEAASIVSEWNTKIEAAGAHIQKTAEVSFL